MGQINIGGANAAVQLQGYTDTAITTDQPFTFPPQGGQLVCYQQGTWTPYATSDAAFLQSGVSAYSAQSGVFTRIGNQVTATFWMRAAEDSWDYVAPITQASDFYVGLLPYDLDTNFPTGSSLVYIMRCADFQFRGYAVQQAEFPVIVFTKFDTNAGSYTDQNAQFQNIFGNLGSGIQFQVTYITDNTDWTPQHGASVS
jgi:hypothetical protein